MGEYPWCQGDYDPEEEAMAAVWGPEMQRRREKKISIQKGSQMHPELKRLLEQYGGLFDRNLYDYWIYGSPMRPMSATWARIPDAVYMQADKSATGYHTYVAVPEALSQEVVARYELKLVSMGKENLGE